VDDPIPGSFDRRQPSYRLSKVGLYRYVDEKGGSNLLCERTDLPGRYLDSSVSHDLGSRADWSRWGNYQL